jgi:hypothetical protein
MVKAGGVCRFEVPIRSDAVAPAGGDVVLTALGQTGSDTLTIAITAPAASPAAGALAAPLPDAVPMTGERLLFFLPAPAWSSTLVIDPSAASGVTPLVGADGSVAVASLDAKGNLNLPTVPANGKYDGSLVKSDKAVSKVALTVRDVWVMPLLVAILGVLAGYGVQTWVQQLRPLRDFRERLNRIARSESSAQDQEAKFIEGQGSKWVGDPASPLIILGSAPNPGILGWLIDDALARYEASPDLSARDDFGPTGDEMKAINAVLKDARSARTLNPILNSAFDRVRTALQKDATQFERQWAGSTWRATVPSLIGGRYVDLDADLTTLVADRTTARTQLARAERAIEIADRLRAAGASEAKVKAIATAIASMRAWDDDGWKAVDGAIAAAAKVEARRDGGNLDLAPAEASSESQGILEAIVALWRMPFRGGALVTPATPSRGAGIGLRVSGFLANVGARFQQSDLLYLAFVLAAGVAMAMTTNYVGKPTFGSLGEYLTLFLWGASASVIADLAKSIVLTRPLGGLLQR